MRTEAQFTLQCSFCMQLFLAKEKKKNAEHSAMLMAKHKKSSHQNGVRTRPKGAESHQYNHRAIFLTSMVMVRSESMESSSTDLKNLRNERNFPIGGALPFKGFAKTLRIK